jgi:hypothetical protein
LKAKDNTAVPHRVPAVRNSVKTRIMGIRAAASLVTRAGNRVISADIKMRASPVGIQKKAKGIGAKGVPDKGGEGINMVASKTKGSITRNRTKTRVIVGRAAVARVLVRGVNGMNPTGLKTKINLAVSPAGIGTKIRDLAVRVRVAGRVPDRVVTRVNRVNSVALRMKMSPRAIGAMKTKAGSAVVRENIPLPVNPI